MNPKRDEWMDAFVWWLTHNTDAQGEEAGYEAECEAETQADIHGDNPEEWDHPHTAAARVRQEWHDDASAEDEDE